MFGNKTPLKINKTKYILNVILYKPGDKLSKPYTM